MAQRSIFSRSMLRNLLNLQRITTANSSFAFLSSTPVTATNSTTADKSENKTKSSNPAFRHSVAYIDERVNHVFNTILADIKSQPTTSDQLKSTSHIFNDPYKFKDLILQELISNSDINQNFNIHELIEEEFQLEISDQEFQQFRSLTNIVQYVNERLEIRRKLANNFSNVNLNQPNLTY